MISIHQAQTLPEDAIDFVKKEWEIADAIHFSRKIEWEKEKKVLVAKEQNEIVGVLEFTVQAGVLYVDDLIVFHSKQGQGIGTKLMQKAEEIARDKKLHKMHLNTGENWPAVKFYERLVYQQTGVLANHYMGIDYIIFTKFL